MGTTVCSHCGADPTAPTVPPSTADVRRFVASILGGGPFTKEYELLGGRLRVELRTISQVQAEWCLRQCYLDQKEGRLQTVDDFFALLIDYRLALSILTLTVEDAPIDVGGATDELLASASSALLATTPLPGLLEAVRSLAPLGSEPIWRMLAVCYRRFASLSAGLEARAFDADFWQATALSS